MVRWGYEHKRRRVSLPGIVRPKPEGAIRLMAIGGSTTMMQNLTFEDTYPEIFPNIKLDEEIPPILEDIKIELAKRYMRSYEKITGLEFKAEISDVRSRIYESLKFANYI